MPTFGFFFLSKVRKRAKLPSRACCCLAIACLLGACQTTATVADRSSGRTTLTQLIDYGLTVRTFNATQLEEAYAALSATNQSRPSDTTSIKLSLLLSDPAASFYDPQRAVRLLDGAARHLEAKGDPMAPFPRLIDRLLRERHAVTRQKDAASAALASERVRNDALTRQLAKSQNDLAAERTRTQTLQSQLDALRALEKQISHDDLSQ